MITSTGAHLRTLYDGEISASLTCRPTQQHAAVHGERQADSGDVLGEHPEHVLGALRQPRRHVGGVVRLHAGHFVPRRSTHLPALEHVGADGRAAVRGGREP